jgi:hypothetical protein
MTPGRSDANVRAAYRLLACLEPAKAPPLDSVRVGRLDGNRYACCDNGTIVVDPDSPFYRAAASGDPWPLMSLMVHEGHHQRYGGDEAGAYASELAFLERHHPEDAALFGEIADLARIHIPMEEKMTDYHSPDPYRAGLAAQRAAAATPEQQFADRYKAERLAALAAEHRDLNAASERRPLPPLTPAELRTYEAPNGYAVALKRAQR